MYLGTLVVARFNKIRAATQTPAWKEKQHPYLKASSAMPSYGWSTIDEFQLYAGPSKVQFLNTFSNTSSLSLSEFREAGQSRMLDVRGNVSIVSPYAIVISSTPLALLDLAGGCCRPAAPISPLDRSLKPYIKADLKGGWKLSEKRKRVDYEWVYLACHSHSRTYFHGVLEAAPKLLWGLRLLHANPSVRVLHDSRHVSELLPVLNLTGRGIVYNQQRGVSANRVTIPPPAQLTAGLVKALRRFSFAHVRLREPEAWRGPNSVIVVRRDVIATDGGRAMLNHDEVDLNLFYTMHVTPHPFAHLPTHPFALPI